MADVIQAWSEIINEEQEASNAWDDEWPEEWLGTQIVVRIFRSNRHSWWINRSRERSRFDRGSSTSTGLNSPDHRK